MKITAKAPCKVIITGEHGVVHGSPALAMSIEPFNTVTLTTQTGTPGITLKLKGKQVELNEKGNVVNGTIDWMVYIELIKHLIEKGIKIKDKILVEIKSNVPKGVGASSSVAAALCIALYKYAGKKISREGLFNDVQFVDQIAHGGSPSGIDAMTILRGPTKLLKIVENEKLKWNFEAVDVSLPKETTLLVIDTFTGGKRVGTGEMIKKVAANLKLLKPDGAVKLLTEFTEEDKNKTAPFAKIYKKIISELKPNGDAVALGKAMNENHELLVSLGAGTNGIETARKIALQAGAFGAKLTGAGGEGGAVIALVKKVQARKIIEKLKQSGFNAFEAKPTRGAAE